MNGENLTFGEKAVGKTFNPSGDGGVNNVKQLSADIINQMHTLRCNSTSTEQQDLAEIAIRKAQEAQMWAVKAITWKD